MFPSSSVFPLLFRLTLGSLLLFMLLRCVRLTSLLLICVLCPLQCLWISVLAVLVSSKAVLGRSLPWLGVRPLLASPTPFSVIAVRVLLCASAGSEPSLVCWTERRVLLVTRLLKTFRT